MISSGNNILLCLVSKTSNYVLLIYLPSDKIKKDTDEKAKINGNEQQMKNLLSYHVRLVQPALRISGILCLKFKTSFFQM